MDEWTTEQTNEQMNELFLVDFKLCKIIYLFFIFLIAKTSGTDIVVLCFF